MDENQAAENETAESGDIRTGDLAKTSSNGETPAVVNRTGRATDAEVEFDATGQQGTVTNEEEELQKPSLSYPVVGFGASAGGLQALREILESLPAKTGMAYVLISHLAPDQRSFLTEITSRVTQMPVKQIEEGDEPQPDHFYILPPAYTVRVVKGVFHLEPRPASKVPMPIDVFFRSLATDQKNHAIGVVLSGADSDGAQGLKVIKGEGGIAIVQTPETAVHGDMPRNSIAADHVDMVLPPRDISTELARLAQQFARPEVQTLEGEVPPPGDEKSFSRILQMLRNAFGLELRQYKPDTIRRRIARHLILLHIESLADYARYLQGRSDELQNLQEDVLIKVTGFFRDPSLWQALSAEILPRFFENRASEGPVRVWCAGCSTGEEVYSLAITFLEYLASKGLDTGVQVFGTDVSARSIEMARAAIYPDSLAAEINPERLRRYFVKVDRGYQVSKHVRDCCIFARQNLSNDPPFSHIDFVSCRNVLIYLNHALQLQVMATLHYALESGGYLLLGMSETLRDYGDSFATIDRKNKIYSKIGTSVPGGYRMPMHPSVTTFGSGDSIVPVAEVWPELELQRAADRIVLARFAPPGLIVDERLNVLQARGQTSPYVQLANGAVSWNLLRVLRVGIVADVREAVERSIRESIPVVKFATFLTAEEGEQSVQIDVLPITSSIARSRCFIVLFTEAEPRERTGAAEQLPTSITVDEKDKYVAQLRQDLSSTHFHLQSLIEERDARNQELVSANEEIQSANEELQSTNEELETTKEELQSTNEELQTVNDELQQRNAVLTQTGNDLANLLNSVNIPLMMLTEDLHIRQFTPPMERLFHVRASDIGRPISEIRLQLSMENIEPILQGVLETLGPREIEVQDRDGRWHLLRVRPYRTADNRIEGLVVVLFDIDQMRRIQQGIREARDFASSMMESIPIPVVILEKDCTIRAMNSAFRELTRMRPNDLTGRFLPDLVKQLWGTDSFSERLGAMAEANVEEVLEFEFQAPLPEEMTLRIRGRSLSSDGKQVILMTMEDITLRRQAEQLAAQQNVVLEKQIQRTGRTLIRAQEELRDLAAHLIAAQEEERRWIARELHDDVAQRLSALRLECDELRKEKDEKARNKAIESMFQGIDALNTDIRKISHRLHPSILDDLGLAAALKAMLDDFREREDMLASFVGIDVPEKIPHDSATALYRITQEALQNVAKHAGKTHVKVALQGEDRLLRLEVRDFGNGFDQDADLPRGGLGLTSMKERARIAGGSLTIRSALGEGTTVSVEVPLRG